MQFYKRPEIDFTALLVVFNEMIDQYRYFQQVMKLHKGEHIDCNEEYAGVTFHGGEDTKKAAGAAIYL